MDEFYAFLFAGIFIIFLLFMFFGGAEVNVQYGLDGYGKGGDFSENDLTWKEIPLGDIISSEKTIKSSEVLADNIKVQNGAFFGSTKYEREVTLEKDIFDGLEEASLSFNIDDTNNYGYLTILINNRTLLYEKPLMGSHKAERSDLKEKNMLEVSTSSSGWKVWAPSVYQMSGLSLDVSYLTKEIPIKEFDVPHYVYQTYYRGELRFDSIYPADLRVFVNGYDIFSKENCYGHTTVPLNRLDVHPEKNEIEFVSAQDFRLENAVVYLYYTNK
ncbi:MAG: hypothetical protein ACP5E4_00230 [Candidatus Aenigmatarchaeota archaeon]